MIAYNVYANNAIKAMQTILPIDAYDERPIVDIYHSFYPSQNNLMHFSEDVRILLQRLGQKSREQLADINRRMTRERLAIRQKIQDFIIASLGGDAVREDIALMNQIMQGEFDGSTIDTALKIQLAQLMIDQRKELIDSITRLLDS